MKKEIIVNIVFVILYFIITSLVLGYSYGFRPNLNENTSTSITLVKTGAINVEADGDNNQVYLNDEFYGIAPKRIDGLIPANYTITIKKEGFNDFESIVKVIEDTYINIKPEMLKTTFGGELLFTENISDNHVYKFFNINNAFVFLSLSNKILNVARLNIQNPIIGFFNETIEQKFEIENFEDFDLKNAYWGIDNANNTVYIYNKSKNVIYLIDLITKTLGSTVDLNGIIIPDSFDNVGQDLYIRSADKIYKYNLPSKILTLKYTQGEEKFEYSKSNPTILFNKSKIRILSSNSTLNDYSEILLKSPKEDIKLLDIYKISQTSLYLLISESYIEVINQKSEQLYFKQLVVNKIAKDGLHILTNNSILKFSFEKSIFVEELFNLDLKLANSETKFNFSDIISFEVFNDRNAILFKKTDSEYISDYFLSSVNLIPKSLKSTKFETIVDSYDNMYLLSLEESPKTISVYKY